MRDALHFNIKRRLGCNYTTNAHTTLSNHHISRGSIATDYEFLELLDDFTIPSYKITSWRMSNNAPRQQTKGTR
jgi:hypothetical protein